VRLEDYHPVGRFDRIDHTPKTMSFSRDLCQRGDRSTYAEVLKRILMAEGGDGSGKQIDRQEEHLEGEARGSGEEVKDFRTRGRTLDHLRCSRAKGLLMCRTR
jgi:hypothetical protein